MHIEPSAINVRAKITGTKNNIYIWTSVNSVMFDVGGTSVRQRLRHPYQSIIIILYDATVF